MISKIYWINETAIGEKLLGTMARPRGDDWLEDEIKGLSQRNISCLVSLLETTEADHLGLEKEKEYCKKWNVEFIQFSIPDVTTPKNEDEFITLAHRLAEKVRKKEKVVMHCRAGIGRSSILAATIMLKLGIEADQVFEIISKHREMHVPDTEEQRDWVLNLFK